MNRIKDFFYDKNDIIVALIILVAAAFIIYMRIGVIMGYPDTLINTAVAEETSASVATSNTSASQTGTTAATDAAVASSGAAATATKTITITKDAAAATVAAQLEKAGLVKSAKDFQTALDKYDMADSIHSGTYQIPTGSTNGQIIEIITKQKVQ